MKYNHSFRFEYRITVQIHTYPRLQNDLWSLLSFVCEETLLIISLEALAVLNISLDKCQQVCLSAFRFAVHGTDYFHVMIN